MDYVINILENVIAQTPIDERKPHLPHMDPGSKGFH